MKNLPPQNSTPRFKHKHVKQHEITNEQVQEVNENGQRLILLSYLKLVKNQELLRAQLSFLIQMINKRRMMMNLSLLSEEGEVFIKSKSNRSQRSLLRKMKVYQKPIINMIQKTVLNFFSTSNRKGNYKIISCKLRNWR
ncbi:unnamed protein product [Paramecium sonneborni]|uniref:Uncharacterized protein n=1 Tax=Paramecium sonneborni TaxID=65129 RepID=A0A8S1RPY3_9CILI|nr:unnamed protein product [Paramecium sonneborni]